MIRTDLKGKYITKKKRHEAADPEPHGNNLFLDIMLVDQKTGEYLDNSAYHQDDLEWEDIDIYKHSEENEGPRKILENEIKQKDENDSPEILFQPGSKEDLLARFPEREVEFKKAVSEGKPVPLHIIEDYADRPWAKKEIERRQIMQSYQWAIEEVRGMESPDEVRSYFETMHEGTAIPATDEAQRIKFYNDIYYRSKFQTPEETRAAWEQSLDTDEKLIGFLKGFALYKDKLKGQGVHGWIWQAIHVITKGNIPDTRLLSKIRKVLVNGATTYRDLLAHFEEDQVAIEQLDYEKFLSKIDTVPEVKFLEGMKLANRMKLAAKTNDADLKKKIFSGELNDKSLAALDKAYRKEIEGFKKQIEEIRDDESFTDSLNKRLGDKSNSLEKERDSLKKEVSRLDEKLEGLKGAARQKIKSLRDEKNKKYEEMLSSYKEALVSARKEAKLQSAEAMRIVKEKLKAAEMKKRRLQEVRDTKERLAKMIIMRPAKGVDIAYKRQIRALQDTLDPKFRRLIYDTDRDYEREVRKLDFERLADISLPEISESAKLMLDKIFKRVLKKPLNLWTIAELEDLANKINHLKEEGRRIKEQKDRDRTDYLQNVGNELAVDVLGDMEKRTRLSFYGSDQTRKELNSTVIQKERALNLRPARFIRTVTDGNDKKLKEHFWNNLNEHLDRTLRAQHKRISAGEKRLAELGIIKKDLSREIEVNGKSYRADDVIHMYLGMGNDENRAAIIFGNGIMKESLRDLFMNADYVKQNFDQGKYTLYFKGVQKDVSFAETEEVVNQYIEQLSVEEKKWGNFMALDFEDNYDRLADVYAVDANEDMVKSKGTYFTMVRQNKSYEDLQSEMIDNNSVRNGWRKGYANKSMTKDRVIRMSPQHQTPIVLGATQIWESQVEKQEHYINNALYVKDLQYLYNNTGLRDAVMQKGGKSWADWFDRYINTYASPSMYKVFDGGTALSRWLRGNLQVGYLSYNLLTMTKQIPSIALFASRTTPGKLIKSTIDVVGQVPGIIKYFATKKDSDMPEVVRFVYEKDPQMRFRMFSRVSDELRARKNQGKARRVVDKVGQAGMDLLGYVDKIVTLIGWTAVYNHNLQLGEAAAVHAAQDAILETQPASRGKDLPELLRSENLKWLTMFGNQTNQIYNILTSDIPFAIRQKQAKIAMAEMAGIGISAFSMIMLTGWRPPEDLEKLPEEFAAQFMLQLAGYVPVAGGAMKAGLSGFGSGGNVPFPMGETLGKLMKMTITGEDDPERWGKLAKSVAWDSLLATGAPSTAIKRVYQGGETLVEKRNAGKAFAELFGQTFKEYINEED